MKRIESVLYPALAPITKNWVYPRREGLAGGLKRRGGFGFLPLVNARIPEQELLSSLEITGKTVYDIGA